MKNDQLNIVILDYGMGNVKSISNAFEKIGQETLLTADATAIANADALVLPGVGAFYSGMQNLQRFNLIESINRFVDSGKPLLGICLGMQMLFDESEEFGNTKGLGLIGGRVVRMSFEAAPMKLPHVSWNEIRPPSSDRWKNTLLEETPDQTDMYFVHSYAAQPADPNDILSITDYGDCTFCSSVQHKNIMGTQFHPEKSGEPGLNILRKFTEITKK
jgi:glutamine amidotransferase